MIKRVLTEIRADIAAARDRDPAARGVSSCEILIGWAGVQALLAHRLAHALREAGVPVAPGAIAYVARALTGVEIHPAASIAPEFFIDHGSGVVIGETAEIGRRVTLYQGVTLGGTGFQPGKRHPTLGNNVTVGSGAKLLGPIAVGDGAKIGANTVVVEDVPPPRPWSATPATWSRWRGDDRRARTPTGSTFPTRSPRRSRRSRSGSQSSSSASPSSTGARAQVETERSRDHGPAAPRPEAEPAVPVSILGAMLQTEPETPAGEPDAPTGAPTEAGADRAERLLAGLNEPQQQAVRHGEGPLLVLAGAGSGKTRVLTHRIAYLLATGQARPGEILAITFTNKAATEMRERVESLVGRATRAMWVTTFHSACARMLRADAERLGYSRGFTIYDESDSLRMLKRCMEELHVDPKRYPPRAIRSQISGAKNQLVDADAYAQAQGSVFEETTAGVYNLYEKRMLEANAMDFDDLLVRTVNALELFEEVRERWRRTFRHVLVDEYQDTNHAQYRLLQLLTSEHGNLMVVGDEDQSIYGFRHADIRNILDFERDFPEADVVKLEQNYRSTQTILSAANAVVENNRERRPKRLWTELSGGEPLQLRELSDEHEEARWVAGEIERLGEEEGVRREDVAVFYRTNAMSRVLEDTLNRFDVPYQVIGGTKFYERAEVKDAVAYLSLLANPADQVSFARIVNSPRRGIGKTSQGRLLSHANTTGMTIWEVIERVEEVPGLGAAAIKSASRFYETMAGLRERAMRRGGRGSARGDPRETGYLEALAAERTVEAEGRAENLEALVAGAAEFDIEREREGESEVPPLEEYLQQISLYTQQDDLGDESVITLMTLHNAKGLEYETVFVVGCEDGSFPHMKALEEGGEEEERRLCYVAITRARSRLYMTWTRERSLFGRAERNLPSRFVDELPEELTERSSSAVGAVGSWGRGPAVEAAAGRSRTDPGAANRRRHRPRQLRRRCRHRGRAGRGRGRALRRRRRRAQADGRLRSDPQAVSGGCEADRRQRGGRPGAGTGARAGRRAGDPARPGDDPGRRRSRLRRVRADEARGLGRGRHRVLPPRARLPTFPRRSSRR